MCDIEHAIDSFKHEPGKSRGWRISSVERKLMIMRGLPIDEPRASAVKNEAKQVIRPMRRAAIKLKLTSVRPSAAMLSSNGLV